MGKLSFKNWNDSWKKGVLQYLEMGAYIGRNKKKGVGKQRL